MSSTLKNKLTKTSLSKDDQQFLVNISKVITYITLILFPIFISGLIYSNLFGIDKQSPEIYQLLHLVILKAFQVVKIVFYLQLVLDIIFAITTTILIYKKKI